MTGAQGSGKAAVPRDARAPMLGGIAGARADAAPVFGESRVFH